MLRLNDVEHVAFGPVVSRRWRIVLIYRDTDLRQVPLQLHHKATDSAHKLLA